MARRQAAVVDQALALIGKRRARGEVHTPYSAAKTVGIALSTIYRAIKRQKKEK